ncbi:MAG: rhomboid family intramembrane serine protease [Elusimicrobia bacterium]|nr:rhomboid family intramembrane serine protease [Elusimicrobiota bacterium]
MIPLYDNIPSRTFPFINLGLIAANFLAFFYELSLGPYLEPFIRYYGLVPAHFSFSQIFSSMFLHGGWMHLISNMWTLYIFGDNVEDRLGHFRYLFFYLLSGLAAAFTQLWFSWGSSVPTIGASGAVAGVMGAYFILFPLARVVTLVPIFIFLQKVQIPAFLFLGIWAWVQFYSGTVAVASGVGHFGGIAWWAHLGGFMGGILLLGGFIKRRHRRQESHF